MTEKIKDSISEMDVFILEEEEEAIECVALLSTSEAMVR